MTSPSPSSKPRRLEPELELVPLAKISRKSVERLAPFCQMRLPQNSPPIPVIQKTNSKILEMIQAIDTSMLVAQIGYRLASEAAAMCDPFVTITTLHSRSHSTLSVNKIVLSSTHGTTITNGNAVMENGNGNDIITSDILQTMAAHGHAHALRTSETFRDVAQKIYKIAAVAKDSEILVLVPTDPQQPATRQMSLKEVGTSLVANLNLLNQFSRSMLELTSWWEWLEEELMSPTSTLLPSPSSSSLSPPTNSTSTSTSTQTQTQMHTQMQMQMQKGNAEQFARWMKIKGGYLDYYNAISVVYNRYPQLLTTSNSAWQSISSVPVKNSPGSSWDGHASYELITSPSMDQLLDSGSGAGAGSGPGEGIIKVGKVGPGSEAGVRMTMNGTKDGKKLKSEGSLEVVAVEPKGKKIQSKLKSVVRKIGLLKVFGRKKGSGQEKAKAKVKKDNEETITVAEDVKVEKKEDKGKGKEVVNMELEMVVVTNETVAIAPPNFEPTITSLINEEAPKEIPKPQQLQDQNGSKSSPAIQPSSPLSSSSSSSSLYSSSPPKTQVPVSESKSKKSGFAKVLASLKVVFAKLSCQNANHIQE